MFMPEDTGQFVIFVARDVVPALGSGEPLLTVLETNFSYLI